MNEDGSVIANFSLTEIGAGTYTSVAQILAEELRFPISQIKISIDSDTDKEPYDWQTVASKGSFSPATPPSWLPGTCWPRPMTWRPTC